MLVFRSGAFGDVADELGAFGLLTAAQPGSEREIARACTTKGNAMSPSLMAETPNYDVLPTTFEATCPDYFQDVVIQHGNREPCTKVRPLDSAHLADNRIGFTYDVIRGSLPAKLRRMCRIGIKWVRMGF